MNYWELTQSPSCLRHFRMEDGGSSLAHDSGPSGVDGSYVGAAVTAGRYGAGRSVSTGEVTRANGLDVSTLAECTLAVWIRWHRHDGQWQTAFRSEARNHHALFHRDTKELGLYLNNRGDFFGSGYFPVGLLEGEWHHLAVTVDRAAPISRFYVDGVEVGAISQQPMSDAAGDLFIGNLGPPGALNQPIGSAIDDATFFDRVLSQEEVAELAAGPEPTNAVLPGFLLKPVVGEPLPREPGVWEANQNGTLVTSTLLEASDDGVASWGVVSGSESASFVLPSALAGRYVRVAAVASNDGGASRPSFGEAARVATGHYRSVVAASITAGGAVAATACPPAGTVAGTVFNSTGVP